MTDTTTTTTAASDAPSVATATVTTTTTTKPGWQTSEFLLSSAAKLLGILFASGLLGDGSVGMRIAGMAATVLAALGYTVSRAIVKSAAMLAVLLLGVGLVTSQVGCSGTAGQRASTGIGSLLDCESPQLVAAVLAAGNLAQAAILSTVSGSGHVDAASFKAALTGIKSEALMCAVNATIAMLSQPPKPSAVMASGLEVDAAELQRVYAMARVELGWPQIHGSGG